MGLDSSLNERKSCEMKLTKFQQLCYGMLTDVKFLLRCPFSREVNREKLDSQPHLIICNVGIEVLNRIVKVQWQGVAKNLFQQCQRICSDPLYFSIFASSSLQNKTPLGVTERSVALENLYVWQLNLHSRPEVAVIYFFAISKCQMSRFCQMEKRFSFPNSCPTGISFLLLLLYLQLRKR